jgi:hypothetical protein
MLAQPNVAYARMEVPLGAQLAGKFSATADMLGALLLVVDSAGQFPQRAAQLRHWFGERLVVAAPGLAPRQRRAWQQRHWPELDYHDFLFDGE